MKEFKFHLLLWLCFTLFSCLSPAPDASSGRMVLPEQRFRGFNLLGKFDYDWSNDGFEEEDFRLISELGFNFVRLPLDYRTYTARGDWYDFQEAEMDEIDQAVEWGARFGVHVQINLHRGPGYCVNKAEDSLPENQRLDLWTDKKAQDAFVAHWTFFARRYKNLSSEQLSFNLLNEPHGVSLEVYTALVERTVKAIHSIDPDRLIFADGLEFGQHPVEELKALDVGQSFHHYQPFMLTHYQAGWVQGRTDWPEPVWPVLPLSHYLYGSWKEDLQSPLILTGNFPQGTEITLAMKQVSTLSLLQISDKTEILFEHLFEPGPGEGEWSEVIYAEEWEIYQNLYNSEHTFQLDHQTEEISFLNARGDWLQFNHIRIIRPGEEPLILTPGIMDWGVKQTRFKLEGSELIPEMIPRGYERFYENESPMQQWSQLAQQGIPLMIGECGVYNRTPHHVTLAYMEDQLKQMDKYGLGWALWNFRGSFGILDSNRADVNYESFQGHKLDREMLELLQRY